MGTAENRTEIVWPVTARMRMRDDQLRAGPPDPKATAAVEADRINADRHLALTARLEHILVGCDWIDRPALLSGIAGYHRDAMSRIPSYMKYPEARPWVEYVLAYERELRRLANLNDDEIAMLRSLDNYLTFRGYLEWGLKRRDPQLERCRAAFLPDTDQGPILLKNAESDLVLWKPQPPLAARSSRALFWWEHVDWVIEGAACGMHLDETEETFPLPVFAMAAQHAASTPEVVEFLRRYSSFWGMENILVVDRAFRATAIEKTSRKYFEVYGPNSHGRCHISGMGCRDANSPQGRNTWEKREEFCRLYNLPDDVIDRAFWKFCDNIEKKLAGLMASLPSGCRAEEVMELFAAPYPKGLCLENYKCRADQATGSLTVTTYATLFEKGQFYRWQRSKDGRVWPAKPEACEFSVP